MEHPDVSRWWANRRKGFFIGLIWGILQTFIWMGVYLYSPLLMGKLSVLTDMSYLVANTLIIMYYINTGTQEFTKDGKDIETHPNPNRWWNTRRLGFYVGIYWSMLQTAIWCALFYVDREHFDVVENIITTSYSVCIVLIVSYYGNTIAETVALKLNDKLK